MSLWSKIREKIKSRAPHCSFHQCYNYINDNCRKCNTQLKSSLLDCAYCSQCKKYGHHFACCYIHRCVNSNCTQTVSINPHHLGYCFSCFTQVCYTEGCHRLAYPWNHCFDHQCRYMVSKCFSVSRYHGYCKKHKI